MVLLVGEVSGGSCVVVGYEGDMGVVGSLGICFLRDRVS